MQIQWRAKTDEKRLTNEVEVLQWRFEKLKRIEVYRTQSKSSVD